MTVSFSFRAEKLPDTREASPNGDEEISKMGYSRNVPDIASKTFLIGHDSVLPTHVPTLEDLIGEVSRLAEAVEYLIGFLVGEEE